MQFSLFSNSEQEEPVKLPAVIETEPDPFTDINKTYAVTGDLRKVYDQYFNKSLNANPAIIPIVDYATYQELLYWQERQITERLFTQEPGYEERVQWVISRFDVQF